MPSLAHHAKDSPCVRSTDSSKSAILNSQRTEPAGRTQSVTICLYMTALFAVKLLSTGKAATGGFIRLSWPSSAEEISQGTNYRRVLLSLWALDTRLRTELASKQTVLATFASQLAVFFHLLNGYSFKDRKYSTLRFLKLSGGLGFTEYTRGKELNMSLMTPRNSGCARKILFLNVCVQVYMYYMTLTW